MRRGLFLSNFIAKVCFYEFWCFKNTLGENCALLNSVLKFIEIKAWLLMTFSYVYAIS